MFKKIFLIGCILILSFYVSFSGDLRNLERTKIICRNFSYKLPDGKIRSLNRQIRVRENDYKYQNFEIVKSYIQKDATIELTIFSDTLQKITFSLADLYVNNIQKVKDVFLAKGYNVISIPVDKRLQFCRLIISDSKYNHIISLPLSVKFK